MNISILARRGGMYCGSCMRDNALATALKRQGHRVTLIPLYTPLRTEPQDASIGQVFYGGVNVYLQHATRLFRKTPRLLDWLFDRPWLLNMAGRYGSTTPPDELGGLTLSILRGEDGPAVKELRRLLQFMKADVRPQVVSLPNLMFIGVAPLLKKELGVPVVCELTGEDIFLDAIAPRDRADAAGADPQRRRPTSTASSRRAASTPGGWRSTSTCRAAEIDVVYPRRRRGVPLAVRRLPRRDGPPADGRLRRANLPGEGPATG